MTQDTTTRTTVDPPPLLPITLAAPKRILVLRAGAFGDIIFALPSLALLKEAWPEAEVHWLAKTPFVPFIGAHPQVDEVIPLGKGAGGFLTALRAIRRNRYDLIIDIHGNLRSGVLGLLSGCPLRVGFSDAFSKEHNHRFTTHQVTPPTIALHRIERMITLVRALPGVPRDSAVRLSLPAWRNSLAAMTDELAELGRTPERPLVAMHAGASGKGAIKRWSDDKYAGLVRRLVDSDYQTLLLWGSPQEKAEAEAIRAAALGETSEEREDAVLIPVKRADFAGLSALFSQCDAVVGVDTGPVHLANALGVPVVGVYGPRTPAIYRPWHPGGRIISKNDEADCPPCDAYRCVNPKGRVCLEVIGVDEVYDAVVAAVAEGLRPGSEAAAVRG